MTPPSMSNSGEDTLSAYAKANYCTIAAIALLMYEYLDTLPDEVNLFWGRKCTGASVLFFINRYCSLLFYIFVKKDYWMLTQAVCETYVKASWGLSLLQYLPWAGFSVLRVYALSRSYTLAGLTLVFFMITIGLNLSHVWSLSKALAVPQLGCFAYENASLQVIIGFVAASRGALILADILVLSVTWVKLHKRTSTLSNRHSLRYILLRDGTVYCICLFLLNTLDLVLTELSITSSSYYSMSYLVLLAEPLTAILISRFMLDLQAVDHRNRNHNSTLGTIGTQTGRGTLFFARAIGSLGASSIDYHGAAMVRGDSEQQSGR
ncbi:hypothetical protein C8Q76DRAFT_707696 [Earliella scabrosa]|nr:hypothetical protein C8Q76DRAFT_707671 [Earliella scabrosa]KAI0740431.1 hypothetical protein C8Q76DRAFT_707696 [Earliella scabrosa]